MQFLAVTLPLGNAYLYGKGQVSPQETGDPDIESWAIAIEIKKATEDLTSTQNSTLVFRNVTIGNKRTSLRLEQTVWDALAEVCQREGHSLSALCERLNELRHEATLTAALRVYVISYFKSAATEEGHAAAGHGSLHGVLKRGPSGQRGGHHSKGPRRPA